LRLLLAETSSLMIPHFRFGIFNKSEELSCGTTIPARELGLYCSKSKQTARILNISSKIIT
jgi:hypothetical protein